MATPTLRGFLSPEVSEFSKQTRAAHARQFEIAERVSELGESVLERFEVTSRDRQPLLTAMLFMRGLHTLQGAIILAERGLVLAARTLVRSSFETAFYLGASIIDADFVEDLLTDHARALEKLQRAHASLPGVPSEDVANLKEVSETAKSLGGDGAALQIRIVAKRAGLDHVYDSFYRGLSTDAAHPTLLSLNNHFDTDSTGAFKDLRWGPDLNDALSIDDTLSLAALAGLVLIEQANVLLKSDEIAAGVTELGPLHQQVFR
jgi:Family of unknown function (DUF5677)